MDAVDMFAAYHEDEEGCVEKPNVIVHKEPQCTPEMWEEGVKFNDNPKINMFKNKFLERVCFFNSGLCEPGEVYDQDAIIPRKVATDGVRLLDAITYSEEGGDGWGKESGIIQVSKMG
jgi:hypothetical protein